ncbi:DUF2155 domain-containing protein [Algimonas porphyrae]|uniref:Cellulase n=1 Tax=Algimonas porphyrae TaxID=1128113 RepID=A0ABQ5UYE8_9PROT|nr:DUF2155 domain-containing protein [Algimonas porphyrae]GLQ19872.1 cellulase [Algimonas porphyrae]
MVRAALIVSLIAAMLSLTGWAWAQSTETNLIGSAVELRALDKVTARTFDYTVPIGETVDFGSLTIHARHCEKTPPTELPETYAFLQIDDRQLTEDGEEAEEGARLFSGWMFASRPAISALDHRVYDVWVIGCVTPDPDTANPNGLR